MKIWLPVGGFILLFIITVAVFGETPEEETQASGEPTATAEPTNTPTATPVPPTPTPLPSVSASQLAQAYDGNVLAADAKYKGQRYRITGRIDSVEKQLFSGYQIEFDTSPYWVWCEFGKSWKDDLLTLNAGDHIEVEGEVHGTVIAAVIIRDCSIP